MLLTIVVTFLVAVGTLAAVRAVYNLVWHPLAKFPGPVLHAISGLPDALATLRGNQYIEILKLHQIYGSVVRIGPTSLSYSTSEAWKDIYALKPDRSQLDRDPTYYKRAGAAHLLNATQTEHKRMRKAIAPFFSDNSLIKHEAKLTLFFNLYIERLAQRIEGSSEGIVDISAYFNYVTFDIIGELVLGKSFGALQSGDYHPWIRNIFSAIKMLGIIRFAAKYPIIGVLLSAVQYLVPSLAAKRRAHRKFTKDSVGQRLRSPSDKTDLIAHILETSSDENNSLNPDEILPNCDILLVAGSETLASHLTGLTWFLVTNPETLQRAQAEVRHEFESIDQITFAAVSRTDRLPFLNAAIQEAFRCYPSIPSILPRITDPAGNRIAGRMVPGRTSVGVHHWSAYHHPDNFHQPEDFQPERWLADAPPCFANDDRDVLQPFHLGPRGCLGKSLAYFEIRSLVTRLLWHFEMELSPRSKAWFRNQKEHALWDRPELWIKLKVK